jgi:hypothetical protein
MLQNPFKTTKLDTLFPYNGIGTVTLQRKKCIENWCNIIKDSAKKYSISCFIYPRFFFNKICV